MTISTYAELQTAVKNWLHREDLASIIPDLITLGEARVYRNVRVRQMEAALSGTTASGVITVPSDYVSLRFAYINAATVQWLERKSAEWIYRNDPSRASGTPRFIARDQSNFIFSPVPGNGKTVSGTYYKRLDPISTTLNSVFTANPGLWLFAALSESAPYLTNDVRLPLWQSKFGDLVREVNAEETIESASGGSLAATADNMSHP